MATRVVSHDRLSVMTCYEIDTRELSFEGEAMTMDLIIEGQRPKVPNHANKWIHELLCFCWHFDPPTRLSFKKYY